MNVMAGKGFTLHELKNMMISTDGRPRVDVCKLNTSPTAWITYSYFKSKKFGSISPQQALTVLLSTPYIPMCSTL